MLAQKSLGIDLKGLVWNFTRGTEAEPSSHLQKQVTIFKNFVRVWNPWYFPTVFTLVVSVPLW